MEQIKEPILSWMSSEEYWQYVEELEQVAVWEKPAHKYKVYE